MSLLDNQDIFGSGPHSIRTSSWERNLDRRGFAGLDGELVLDMGLRGRNIHQTGRLQAQTASQLQSLITQIESFIDGKLHTLEDNYGTTYDSLVIEEFKPTTPLKLGRGYFCEYEVRYRQLQ